MALARPARDQRLDVIRGGLQIFIFVSHIANSFVGGWLIHRAWGLSDSSEQFLFLSGLMLGSVFTLKAARGPALPAVLDIFRRAARLYRTHLTMCALFFAMLALVSLSFLPGELARLGWGWMLAQPLHAIPAMLALIYEPDWMDILPMFVWGMLLLPPFLLAESRVGAWALLPPLAVYLATQLGRLHAPGLSETVGMGFDPFAWQLIYLLGAWLGRMMPPGRRWRMRQPLWCCWRAYTSSSTGMAGCIGPPRRLRRIGRMTSRNSPGRGWCMLWRWPGWLARWCRAMAAGCAPGWPRPWPPWAGIAWRYSVSACSCPTACPPPCGCGRRCSGRWILASQPWACWC